MNKMKSYVSLICIFALIISSTMTANAADIYAKRATYLGDTTTVKYMPKGDYIYYHVGGTLSWRTNNPGNLRADKEAIGIYTNDNGRYAIFPSYEEGLKAMIKLLKRKYANYTIEKMIEKYAPKKDGNDPEKYIAYLVKKTGMSRDTKINEMDSKQFKKYVKYMIKHEGFRKGKVVRTDIIISPE